MCTGDCLKLTTRLPDYLTTLCVNLAIEMFGSMEECTYICRLCTLLNLKTQEL